MTTLRLSKNSLTKKTTLHTDVLSGGSSNSHKTNNRGMKSIGILKGSRIIPVAGFPSTPSETVGQGPSVNIVPSGSTGWGTVSSTPSHTEISASSRGDETNNSTLTSKPLTTLSTTLSSGIKTGHQKPFYQPDNSLEEPTNERNDSSDKPAWSSQELSETPHISGTGGASEIVGTPTGWAAADSETIDYDEKICFSDEEDSTPLAHKESLQQQKAQEPVSWRAQPVQAPQQQAFQEQWQIFTGAPPMVSIANPLLLTQPQVMNPVMKHLSSAPSAEVIEDDGALNAAQRSAREKERDTAIQRAHEDRKRAEGVQPVLKSLLSMDPNMCNLDSDQVWHQFKQTVGADIPVDRQQFEAFFNSMKEMVKSSQSARHPSDNKDQSAGEQQLQQRSRGGSFQQRNTPPIVTTNVKEVPSLMDLETQPSSEHLQNYFERNLDAKFSSRGNSSRYRGIGGGGGASNNTSRQVYSTGGRFGCGGGSGISQKPYYGPTRREDDNWRAPSKELASEKSRNTSKGGGGPRSHQTKHSSDNTNATFDHKSQLDTEDTSLSRPRTGPISANRSTGSGRIFSAATAAANASCATASSQPGSETNESQPVVSSSRGGGGRPQRGGRNQRGGRMARGGKSVQQEVQKMTTEMSAMSPPSSGASTLLRGSSVGKGAGSVREEEGEEWETATEGSGSNRRSDNHHNPQQQQQQQQQANVFSDAQRNPSGGHRGVRGRGKFTSNIRRGDQQEESTSGGADSRFRRGGRNRSGMNYGRRGGRQYSSNSQQQQQDAEKNQAAAPRQEDFRSDDGASSISGGPEFVEVLSKKVQRQKRLMLKQQQEEEAKKAAAAQGKRGRATGLKSAAKTPQKSKKPAPATPTDSSKSTPSHRITTPTATATVTPLGVHTEAWSDASKTVSVLIGKPAATVAPEPPVIKPINQKPPSQQNQQRKNDRKSATTTTKPKEVVKEEVEKKEPPVVEEKPVEVVMPVAPVATQQQTSPNNVCKVRPQQQLSGGAGGETNARSTKQQTVVPPETTPTNNLFECDKALMNALSASSNKHENMLLAQQQDTTAVSSVSSNVTKLSSQPVVNMLDFSEEPSQMPMNRSQPSVGAPTINKLQIYGQHQNTSFYDHAAMYPQQPQQQTNTMGLYGNSHGNSYMEAPKYGMDFMNPAAALFGNSSGQPAGGSRPGSSFSLPVTNAHQRGPGAVPYDRSGQMIWSDSSNQQQQQQQAGWPQGSSNPSAAMFAAASSRTAHQMPPHAEMKPNPYSYQQNTQQQTNAAALYGKMMPPTGSQGRQDFYPMRGGTPGNSFPPTGAPTHLPPPALVHQGGFAHTPPGTPFCFPQNAAPTPHHQMRNDQRYMGHSNAYYNTSYIQGGTVPGQHLAGPPQPQVATTMTGHNAGNSWKYHQ